MNKLINEIQKTVEVLEGLASKVAEVTSPSTNEAIDGLTAKVAATNTNVAALEGELAAMPDTLYETMRDGKTDGHLKAQFRRTVLPGTILSTRLMEKELRRERAKAEMELAKANQTPINELVAEAGKLVVAAKAVIGQANLLHSIEADRYHMALQEVKALAQDINRLENQMRQITGK